MSPIFVTCFTLSRCILRYDIRGILVRFSFWLFMQGSSTSILLLYIRANKYSHAAHVRGTEVAGGGREGRAWLPEIGNEP